LYLQYNLTVDDAHTFFVGEQSWLVHNTCTWPPTVTTDGQGRPTRVEVRLTNSVLGLGSDPSFRPPGYDTNLGHHRGHLLARQLGGGGGMDNIVILYSNINNGPMSSFESRIANVLRRNGTIDYTVDVIWGGTNNTWIPMRIEINATGFYGNGTPYQDSLTLNNVP
jgi:DNA/RNA non-specific endonuclease